MLAKVLAAALLLLVPAQSEFRLVPQTITRTSTQLSRASSVPHEGIAYTFSKAKNAAFSLSHDIDFFDTLSEADFERLKETYSGWSASPSQVKYKSGARYTLVDFLPLAMQATSSFRFIPQQQTVSLPSFGAKPAKSTPQQAEILTNCWGFAYDVLSASLSYQPALRFTLPSPTNAWAVLTDPAAFETVQSGNVKDRAARNRDLQPGDVLLVYHQNKGEPIYLDHAAIFVDNDLYFERAGTGDDVPFRLNTFEGLASSWMPLVFEYRWIRVKAGASLKAPAKAFALDSPVSLKEVSPQLAKLKDEVKTAFSVTPQFDAKGKLEKQTYVASLQLDNFVFDEMGRAKLPASAFKSESFKVAVPANIYRNNLKGSLTTEEAGEVIVQ